MKGFEDHSASISKIKTYKTDNKKETKRKNSSHC